MLVAVGLQEFAASPLRESEPPRGSVPLRLTPMSTEVRPAAGLVGECAGGHECPLVGQELDDVVDGVDQGHAIG